MRVQKPFAVVIPHKRNITARPIRQPHQPADKSADASKSSKSAESAESIAYTESAESDSAVGSDGYIDTDCDNGSNEYDLPKEFRCRFVVFGAVGNVGEDKTFRLLYGLR
jgi:hypothetical protein